MNNSDDGKNSRQQKIENDGPEWPIEMRQVPKRGKEHKNRQYNRKSMAE